MAEINYVCKYSPRFVLRPIVVAVVERVEEIDLFWDPNIPMSVYPHGIYIVERSKAMPKDPRSLFNEDGTFPSDETLMMEGALLKEQSCDRPSGWVAQRLAAICAHLGFMPKQDVVPSDHPRKIPNRRLP